MSLLCNEMTTGNGRPGFKVSNPSRLDLIFKFMVCTRKYQPFSCMEQSANTIKGISGYLKLGGQVLMGRLLFCQKLGGQLPTLPASYTPAMMVKLCDHLLIHPIKTTKYISSDIPLFCDWLKKFMIKNFLGTFVLADCCK